MVRLKELRQQNGYTQKELSKLVNYSQNLISTWESGTHESNNKALVSLANIFNVSVDYLIGSENNVPKEINNSL
ncbi:MAG: helix-turn-helix transcriptional regulator, partial [Eubacteriales bacterium]|nr:helix-turn-helix transcriptional regulator [Eubacteriales bacterium]